MSLDYELQEACKNGKIEKIQSLLDQGADVNARYYLSEYAPLFRAIEGGYKNIAELLIENGANVHAKDSCGLTPLHVAASNDYKETVVLLLIYGAILDDYTKHIINNSPRFQNCLEAFEQIKAMPHLGKLIEANTKKEGAKTIASYINNEAEGQKLIEEFKTIKEKYGSDEQLSFIPERLFSTAKYIAQDHKKIKIASEAAGDFLKVINSADDTKETGYSGSDYIGPVLNQYLDNKDRVNLAFVNKQTYEKLKPINTLLTALKEVISPQSIVLNKN